MDGISPGLRARLLLNRQDFHTAHALGQNFLLDEALLSGLLDLSGVGPEDAVLEIGPGAGVMTCLLADRARRVVAVELDRRLEPILREMLEGKENVRVVFADALKADLGEIMGEPFRVVANLPYYITADAVRKFLGSGYPIRSVHIMVQKEAAERMLARPGEKQWCLLAALAQYYARVRLLAEVPPEAFEPQPHVMSAVFGIGIIRAAPGAASGGTEVPPSAILRLCHAQKDLGQQPLGFFRPFQRGGEGSATFCRAGSARARRGADTGGVLPPVGQHGLNERGRYRVPSAAKAGRSLPWKAPVRRGRENPLPAFAESGFSDP